jgi:hypothetical protein
MKIGFPALLVLSACAYLTGGVASADSGPSMKCRVTVPKEYRKTPFNPPPNGQPEPVRYKVAYEAFWWNCVAVQAADLEGRCPFVASGTPAASAGAGDGAINAEDQICRLRKKYSASAVQGYLKSIASQPVAKQKMAPYFHKPTPEVVN